MFSNEDRRNRRKHFRTSEIINISVEGRKVTGSPFSYCFCLCFWFFFCVFSYHQAFICTNFSRARLWFNTVMKAFSSMSSEGCTFINSLILSSTFLFLLDINLFWRLVSGYWFDEDLLLYWAFSRYRYTTAVTFKLNSVRIRTNSLMGQAWSLLLGCLVMELLITSCQMFFVRLWSCEQFLQSFWGIFTLGFKSRPRIVKLLPNKLSRKAWGLDSMCWRGAGFY